MKIETETYKRRAIFAKLKPHCTFARDNDFIEVTEWYNGEGVTVNIESLNAQTFNLTWGEFDVIKKIMKKLNVIEPTVAVTV